MATFYDSDRLSCMIEDRREIDDAGAEFMHLKHQWKLDGMTVEDMLYYQNYMPSGGGGGGDCSCCEDCDCINIDDVKEDVSEFEDIVIEG